ncbi:MAG: alpha/beta fold hydrolase [Aliidongia sp.]
MFGVMTGVFLAVAMVTWASALTREKCALKNLIIGIFYMKIVPINLTDVESKCAVRVFCLPYAGGSALIYRGWQQLVPDWMHVCPIELPGRGTLFAEAPAHSLAELAREVSAVLLACEGHPFALFGHSMGALIAYEAARTLELAGSRSLVYLFLSGARPPFLSRNHEPISHLPDSEFIEKLRKLNGTPKEVLDHGELMELLLPVIKNDFRIVERHEFEHGKLIDTPTVAFTGVEDSEVSVNDVYQWSKLINSRLRVVELSGDHFFIKYRSKDILKEMTNCLSSPFREHSVPKACSPVSLFWSE